MPTITRIIGLHNENLDSNTDRVWAGVVLREQDETYRFVSLYGRRGQMLRPAPQPPTYASEALRQFNRAHRDKLAHGYRQVDWTNARFGMLAAIRRLGDFSPAIREEYDAALGDRSANQRQERERLLREGRDAERDRSMANIVARRRREQAMADVAQAFPQPEPDLAQKRLSRYLREKTGQPTEPEPEPETKAKPVEPEKPWIRKAWRRV